MVVTGAIDHGRSSQIFLRGESARRGASHFLDVLSSMIQTVYEMSHGNMMPKRLVVVTDNTMAQAKNSESCVYLSWLVAKSNFQSANFLALAEGRSREDIDHFLGLTVSLVLKRHAVEARKQSRKK